MTSMLIHGATIVNEGLEFKGDVFINKGKIDKVGENLSHIPAETVLNATGKYLLPGMIDGQVHFREPGLTHKADIATESKAAVAGGITSYLEMPNVKPATTNNQALADKYGRAEGRSYANFGFYLGATNDNLEDIRNLDPQLACAVKIFMGSSTGKMLVDNIKTLEAIFAECPIGIATHCEDTPTILANEKKYKQLYANQIPVSAHPQIRSREACFKSSQLAISLAKKHDSRLHVLHLTTAEELEQFTPSVYSRDKKITAEACVHHLWFDERDYAKWGNLIKCNPAIKTAQDRDAIWRAVKDNRIDVIATDHAPHTFEEKQGDYFNAPAGIPLVQHALLSLLYAVKQKKLSLPELVTKVAHVPANLYQVHQRGFIREGYWADLVLVDLNSGEEITENSLLYKCGWSPFVGVNFGAQIESTWVNGQQVYQSGEFLTEACGKKIDFDR